MGLNLFNLDRSAAKFVVFCFDDPEFLAENFIEDYWAGNLKLDPKELIRNIKELKNRLYAKRAIEN